MRIHRFAHHGISALLFGLLALCGAGCDGTTPVSPTDAGPRADAGPEACGAEVEVGGEISEDTRWSCPTYLLTSKLFVTNGATLTIDPGTTILGDTSASDATALIVTRGARLVAEGTREAPIVFTSANPEGARLTGDWAGVALLGGARVNSGACVDDADPSTEDLCDAPGFFESRLEGIDVGDDRGRFGGADDEGNCGSLRYVRIEFAGAELSPNNELNGLTIGGCGSSTSISYVQVHRGKDDGIEIFGGTAGMDHVVISGASDDSLDWDLGWRGQVQFLVVHQLPGVGDSGFEADNLGADEDAEPRSNPTLFNVTMIGTPDTRGMVLREGTLGVLRNFILTGFGSEAVDLRASQVDLNVEWPANLSIESSFFFDNGDYAVEVGEEDDDMGYDERAAIEDPARNNTTDLDPGLGALSGPSPDYVPTAAGLEGQATPTFGDGSATYAGAFAPNATERWTDGWTAYPAS